MQKSHCLVAFPKQLRGLEEQKYGSCWAHFERQVRREHRP